MSGPIRMVIGAAVRRLKGYMVIAKELLEIDEPTEDDLTKLREQQLHIKRTVTLLDDKNKEWTVYLSPLGGADYIRESAAYEAYRCADEADKHFIEILDDARELLTN